MMTIVKAIYSVTIAAFLIMLVAFGIAAFYSAPEPPVFPNLEPPAKLVPAEPSATPSISPPPGSSERDEQIAAYEEASRAWEQARKDYHRNVFFIAFPVGLLYLILGIALRPRLDILRPGLLLGGIGTMLYGLAQENITSQVRFIGVAVALIALIVVGYRLLVNRKATAQE